MNKMFFTVVKFFVIVGVINSLLICTALSDHDGSSLDEVNSSYIAMHTLRSLISVSYHLILVTES